MTRDVLDNKVLQNALQVVHDQVLEGADISTPMKQSGVFPATVSYMIGVGEQAGNLRRCLSESPAATTRKLTSPHSG